MEEVTQYFVALVDFVGGVLFSQPGEVGQVVVSI